MTRTNISFQDFTNSSTKHKLHIINCVTINDPHNYF